MLQACLNGSRTAEEHPALPLTPARLAEDAADVAALGVTSVHLHPRDVVGVELVVAAPIDLTNLPPGTVRITVTATLQNAETLLQQVEPLGLPVLLHGRDADAWPVLTYAATLEHSVRMGLEDTLHMPDGRQARNNAELIAMARRNQRSRAPS